MCFHFDEFDHQLCRPWSMLSFRQPLLTRLLLSGKNGTVLMPTEILMFSIFFFFALAENRMRGYIRDKMTLHLMSDGPPAT
jgi:hypothetical protein